MGRAARCQGLLGSEAGHPGSGLSRPQADTELRAEQRRENAGSGGRVRGWGPPCMCLDTARGLWDSASPAGQVVPSTGLGPGPPGRRRRPSPSPSPSPNPHPSPSPSPSSHCPRSDAGTDSQTSPESTTDYNTIFETATSFN